jgi:DNA-binding LacI/PurR family transcriptional regulator
VDISELGERATARLLDLMKNPMRPEPNHETLATTLVVRRSCGARRP